MGVVKGSLAALMSWGVSEAKGALFSDNAAANVKANEA